MYVNGNGFLIDDEFADPYIKDSDLELYFNIKPNWINDEKDMVAISLTLNQAMELSDKLKSVITFKESLK